MASELLEIKSNSLIPNNEKEEKECDIDNEVNTKEKLVSRLLEYEKYKNMTSVFRSLEDSRSEIFIKAPENRSNYTNTSLINDGSYDATSLYNAFLSFIERKKMEKPLITKVTEKEYSIRKRTNEIRGILTVKRHIKFMELFDNFSRDYIIVTFLSILNMAKDGELVIVQDNNFEEITLRLKGSDFDE